MYALYNIQVRQWANKTARTLSPVSVDDYDSLREVIQWIVNVVDLNLFQNSELIPLEAEVDDCSAVIMPKHLFNKDSETAFWNGLCSLLLQFEKETVNYELMSTTGHRSLLDAAMHTMEDAKAGNHYNYALYMI